MRRWDRFFATAFIWFVAASLLYMFWDKFTSVRLSFDALWPNVMSPNEVMNIDWSQISQKTDEIIRQANLAFQSQLQAQMPMIMALSIALIVAATLSTWFIWRGELHAGPARPAVKGGKAKRGSTVERIVDLLNDDELMELRDRLGMPEDERTATLEELLAARESEAQARR
jgi:hypothetical protein